MFDKREDPKLINAVKSVMEKNKQIREHQDAVNKKYGVYSRAGLPNELHADYDKDMQNLQESEKTLPEEALLEGRKKEDKRHAGPFDRGAAEYDRELAALNSGKTQNLTEESEQLDETKWNYPEKLKKKADLDHPYGPYAMKDKRRKERKLWRKKMKAKAHKELMMTKEESEQLEEGRMKDIWAEKQEEKRKERLLKLAEKGAAARKGPGGDPVLAITKSRRRPSKIMEAVIKKLYEKKMSGNGGSVKPTKKATHGKDQVGPNYPNK